MTNRLTPQVCEKMVVAKLVRDILNAGCQITVNDGEEVVISKSADYDAIIAAMFSTENDVLIVYRPADGDTPRKRLGAISLVYGNGRDVICDHTANDDIEALVQPAFDYAERLPA